MDDKHLLQKSKIHYASTDVSAKCPVKWE